MADYPASFDSLTNPTNTDKLNNPSHSQQHQNVNDIVEALEAKLGIGASTPTAGKVLRATGVGTTAYGQVDLSTDVASFTSAALRAALSDETGTGAAVFATSPAIVTPTIASFANSNHDHTNSAGGGTLGTNAVSAASILATGVVTSPKQSTELQQGWESSYGETTFPPPSTVTCNGNRSCNLVFNSVDLTGAVSPGMRLRTTRTVAAPTQCADLEASSSQGFTVTNATGLATGTTWTFKAKIKPESYGAMVIVAIDDGTNIVQMYLNASGQIVVFGGTAGTADTVTSYQSVVLNKWQDVTGSITIGTPTGEIRIDDVVVPSLVGASAATTMTISGDEEIYIGRNAAGTYFDGKICQVAIFNSIVSDATLKTYSGQTMTGSETGCEGFWSLNNTLADLSANANTLVASGGALATNADSPFSVNSFGTATGTTDYGVVTACTFSTNTTLTVQVPEGNTIPTSGGISASYYSTQETPYGFPTHTGKWTLESIYRGTIGTGSIASTATVAPFTGGVLEIKVGKWRYYINGFVQSLHSGTTYLGGTVGLSTSTSSFAVSDMNIPTAATSASTVESLDSIHREGEVDLSASTPYYLVASPYNNNTTHNVSRTNSPFVIRAVLDF